RTAVRSVLAGCSTPWGRTRLLGASRVTGWEMPDERRRSWTSTTICSRLKGAGRRAFASSCRRTHANEPARVVRDERQEQRRAHRRPGREQEADEARRADALPGVSGYSGDCHEIGQCEGRSHGELHGGVARRDRTAAIAAAVAQDQPSQDRNVVPRLDRGAA